MGMLQYHLHTVPHGLPSTISIPPSAVPRLAGHVRVCYPVALQWVLRLRYGELVRVNVFAILYLYNYPCFWVYILRIGYMLMMSRGSDIHVA